MGRSLWGLFTLPSPPFGGRGNLVVVAVVKLWLQSEETFSPPLSSLPFSPPSQPWKDFQKLKQSSRKREKYAKMEREQQATHGKKEQTDRPAWIICFAFDFPLPNLASHAKNVGKFEKLSDPIRLCARRRAKRETGLSGEGNSRLFSNKLFLFFPVKSLFFFSWRRATSSSVKI